MAARQWRRGLASVLLPAMVGCGAVSADPEEVASQLPAERELGEIDSARLERLTAEALQFLDEERYPEAEEAARNALTLQPRAPRPRAVLGACLMRKAQRDEPPDLRLWRQAEGELLAATRTDPSDTWLALMYARFLVADGHLTAAAEVVEAALDQNVDDLDALRLAAETRYELGEERLARPHLTRLVELTGDPQSVYRLAWCLLRLADGDLDDKVPLLVESAESFARYRELVPDDPEGYLAQGRALIRAAEEVGEEDSRTAWAQQAMAVYEQAAERFPESAAPWFGRALCLELLADSDRAIESYQNALERNPGHIGALLNLAALHAAAGRRDLAEPLCRRALDTEGLTAEERQRVMDYLGGRRRWPQAPMML